MTDPDWCSPQERLSTLIEDVRSGKIERAEFKERGLQEICLLDVMKKDGGISPEEYDEWSNAYTDLAYTADDLTEEALIETMFSTLDDFYAEFPERSSPWSRSEP